MNSTFIGVITLLKSAITGKTLSLSEDFDLEKGVRLLKQQGLQAMGYLGAANCGIPKSEPVMLELFRSYCQSAVKSQRQLDKIQQLQDAFEAEGIDYMPLKGAIMKHLYPHHELRPMGDADILIRTEQYDRVKQIMEALGYEAGRESDHELPWKSPDLYVELHKKLIPSYNQDLYAYYGDGWRLANPQSGHRYQMRCEDQFLYLFTHFAKHYRDGGVGCRPVLDLWVLRDCYPNIDEAYILRELKKLRLAEFYHNIRALMDAWFSDGRWDDKTQFITQYLFSSGTWGDHKQHAIADHVKLYQKFGSVKKGKIRLFFSGLFPSVQVLGLQYPVVKKVPLLLPVMWIVRLFDSIFLHPERMKRGIGQMQTPDYEQINDWERAMAYVGLRYWHNS